MVSDDYEGRLVSSNLPWGIAFPEGLPPTAVPVHPTQLYGAALVPLVILLTRWRRSGRPARFVLGAYLVLGGCDSLRHRIPARERARTRRTIRRARRLHWRHGHRWGALAEQPSAYAAGRTAPARIPHVAIQETAVHDSLTSHSSAYRCTLADRSLTVTAFCVRTVSHAPRNLGQTRRFTARRGGISMLRKVLDQEYVGAFRCASARAAGTNFQACSIDHSDISPFRINDLRAGRDQNIAKLPFTHIHLTSCVVPIICRHAAVFVDRNCDRPRKGARSLTASAAHASRDGLAARALWFCCGLR
jgi:hypothetical protein